MNLEAPLQPCREGHHYFAVAESQALRHTGAALWTLSTPCVGKPRLRISVAQGHTRGELEFEPTLPSLRMPFHPHVAETFGLTSSLPHSAPHLTLLPP